MREILHLLKYCPFLALVTSEPKERNGFFFDSTSGQYQLSCRPRAFFYPRITPPTSRFQYCRHLLKNIVARLLEFFTAFCERWPVLRIISCTRFTSQYISDIGNKFFLFLCFHIVGRHTFISIRLIPGEASAFIILFKMFLWRILLIWSDTCCHYPMI